MKMEQSQMPEEGTLGTSYFSISSVPRPSLSPSTWGRSVCIGGGGEEGGSSGALGWGGSEAPPWVGLPGGHCARMLLLLAEQRNVGAHSMLWGRKPGQKELQALRRQGRGKGALAQRGIPR